MNQELGRRIARAASIAGFAILVCAFDCSLANNALAGEPQSSAQRSSPNEDTEPAEAGAPLDTQGNHSINEAIRLGRYDTALKLLEPAARAGNADAQYRLASFYRSGLGTKPDPALAFRWMKSSAEAGHTKAQYNLATMYLAARGTAFDAGKAQEWLRKAAAAGYSPAKKLLADIAAKPPPTLQKAPATAEQNPPERPLTNAALKTEPQLATRNGQPALIDAALRGQIIPLRQLIEAGADVNVTNAEGNTALAIAATAGKLQLAELL